MQKVPNSDRMDYIFSMVSKTLKGEFRKLQWQQFQGSEEEFKGLRSKMLNKDGEPRKKYIGMEGYALFAEKHYEGVMQKAFINISAVLEKEEFEKLRWQAFQGPVKEFKGLRSKILNKDGEPREEYVRMEGYALFAKKHYVSDMHKAFKNISAVLEEEEFKKLQWQAFYGSVKEFKGLRSKILNKDGEPREEYVRMEGYALFAEKYYAGNMQKTFQNISAVLEKKEFERLKWQQFHGSVKEFKEIRGKILNEGGEPREEYVGVEGYALFAEKYYAGVMQKAFQNISAVLGGALNMKELGLGWKVFNGSVSEYRNLVQFFEENKAIELQGIEGQKRVAEKIFKGQLRSHLRKTYKNVSALKEVLLGNRKAFTDLNWSSNL